MVTHTSKKERNTNIEILRFTLMVFIFLWHLLVHGCDFEHIGNIDYKYNIHLSIIAAIIFVPCTNCFMFISGWYGMKFRVSKLINISFILIISGLICFLINRYISFGGGGIKSIYTMTFPISTKYWWFMTAYVMVYLIAPFLEKGMKHLNKNEIISIIVSMTMIEVLSIPLELNWGSSFFGLLYIYIIGRFMKLHGLALKQKQSFILYLGMTFIMLLALELIYLAPIKRSALFWSLQYNNPTIVLQAISLFFIIKNLKPHYNKAINKLFQPCLCIYLITEKTLSYKFIVDILEKNALKGIIAIVAIIIACLLVGHIIFFIAKETTTQLKSFLQSCKQIIKLQK